MRIIAQFKKQGDARFISHLDLQRTIGRALRRSKLPVKYSLGFNPHIVLSFATALSVGLTSDSEFFDVAMAEDMSAERFFELLNPNMPFNLELVSTHVVPDSYKALTALLAVADYEACFKWEKALSFEQIENALKQLLSAPIMAMKKSKSGIKEVDIAPMIYSMELKKLNDEGCAIALSLECSTNGALNPQLLAPFIENVLEAKCMEICRMALLGQHGENKIQLWEAAL